MSYPQPIPTELVPALNELTPPFAIALALNALPDKTPLPSVLLVASPLDAFTWAKTPHLKIGVTQLGTQTAFGAVYGLSVDLFDDPDQPVGCYTTLDVETPTDLALLRLISQSERMGVAFADTKRMIQGIKTIGWSLKERRMAASFIEEAQYHNALLKGKGNFDIVRARAVFDEFYVGRTGPLYPL